MYNNDQERLEYHVALTHLVMTADISKWFFFYPSIIISNASSTKINSLARNS
jgi:hypothetical protein